MPRCDVCGNEYDKTMSIDAWGRRHTFDCFECAIQRLAPVCAHCRCRVVGHGVEVDGPEGDTIFCCAHCARESTGLDQLRDRAAQSPRAVPDAG
jgi:hypothetical protein